MASISSYSSYNGELARLNKELNAELMRSDILKSEELGTCEFISEIASVYLEVIKEFKALPFAQLEEKLAEADRKILDNILEDRRNLIAARDSYFENGKLIPLKKENILALLEKYGEENKTSLNHIRKTFDIHAAMDFDAFETKMQQIIDQQVDLWGQLEDQRTTSNMRVFSIMNKKAVLKERRECEEAGESDETIYSAARSGSLQRVKDLTRHFWGIGDRRSKFLNTQDQEGNLPLHLAAFFGHEDIVDFLLTKDAKIDIIDGIGRQAIHWAAKGGHERIVALFLGKKVSIDARDSLGRTSLHYATYNGLKSMTQFLLGRGASINAQAQGESNTTPLIEAILNKHSSIVSELVKSSHLDVKTVDSQGRSAVYYATSLGDSHALALLTTHRSWSLPTDLNDFNHPTNLLSLTPASNGGRIQAILEKALHLR